MPKQRVLNESETPNSFTTWVEAMKFNIVIDNKLSRFADTNDLGTWGPESTANRGFTNDTNDIAEAIRMTAVQKAALLKCLLGSIAGFCPVISNPFITEQATSLETIFDKLRSHYGFRKTGGRILELSQLVLGPNESYETLWERLSAFIEDNLLKAGGNIQHLGTNVTANENPTPMVHNMLVVLWLKIINPSLPMMIKQRFATQLRTHTVYSLRDDISEAIPSVLAEMQDREYSINFAKSFNRNKSNKSRSKYNQRTSSRKRCCLCDSANRPDAGSHYLTNCPFLPIDDKRYISKLREVVAVSDSDDDSQSSGNSSSVVVKEPAASRVSITPSPVLDVFVGSCSGELTLDTGAEINLIKVDACKDLKIPVSPASQKACQADGISPLDVVGEVHFKSTRGHHEFQFDGLAVRTLNCDILAGMPFQELNDVYVRPSEGIIYIGDCCKIKYKTNTPTNAARSCKAAILRVPQKVCLHPGEDISIPVPAIFKEEVIALEPRSLSPSSLAVPDWLEYQLTTPNPEGQVVLKNSSQYPVLLKKDEQVAQIRHVEDVQEVIQSIPPVKPYAIQTEAPFSNSVSIDPSNILSSNERAQFQKINLDHDDLFSPKLGGYNGHSGPFTHVINMGPSLPPQRRGKSACYSRSNQELLQMEFDKLQSQGVFAKPEDIGVNVEYTNPSFLVKKSDGTYRLVTSFTEIGQHVRPQPSVMPDVNEVLRQVAQWKYLIKTDLKTAYYLMHLSHNSMKYAGVNTPFRGILVYTRAVMGLPGSEASLECLLSRILGDLIMEGSVVKMADDLYIGADTVAKLLKSWESVLHLLQINGLKLSPKKTVICPTSTVILGWLWEQGTIQATPHRINALLKCDPPPTVGKMRSFLGSFKFLSKVLPRHADVLGVFEKLCPSTTPAAEKILWTEDLLQKFEEAKHHLKSAKIITLPRRDDALQIITDASSKGIAAALYSIRNDKPYLSGVFNAQRRAHQTGWLPCELEALSITTSVKHFSPYIVQSTQKTRVLTDSKPCVEAYKKISRGSFSSSPRVMTFLSTLSHYQIEVEHLSGKNNTFSDFLSRHPVACDGTCQICSFIEETEDSVVRAVNATDILAGKTTVPYTTRGSWYQIQQDCRDLHIVAKHLKDGSTPHRKQKGMKDVKRYLNRVKLSTNPSDGLLIVTEVNPLQPIRQRIVVPRGILDGLLTAMHIRLSHPSKDQLKQVFNRAFFALDLDRAAGRVLNGCHQCVSLKNVPTIFSQQSTSEPPVSVGSKFSADVIRRERQMILLMREYTSSLTDATFIQGEDGKSLKEGLVKLLCRLRPPSGPPVITRVDPATGFQSLKDDALLSSLGISLELGEPKNVNKNPVSEKAISEFHAEITKIQPEGGPLNDTNLSIAIANINSRVRGSGFSSLEMWTKRDMATGQPVEIDDEQLIANKQKE